MHEMAHKCTCLSQSDIKCIPVCAMPGVFAKPASIPRRRCRDAAIIANFLLLAVATQVADQFLGLAVATQVAMATQVVECWHIRCWNAHTMCHARSAPKTRPKNGSNFLPTFRHQRTHNQEQRPAEIWRSRPDLSASRAMSRSPPDPTHKHAQLPPHATTRAPQAHMHAPGRLQPPDANRRCVGARCRRPPTTPRLHPSVEEVSVHCESDPATARTRRPPHYVSPLPSV